jgi:hypothetical protein
MVPQDISRRALRAGIACEQDDASAAKRRNKERAATMPSYRAMRYSVATDLPTSSSAHNDLFLRTLWCALKTIRKMLQYGHGNQTSDQIQSATRCVQTAAELTDIGSRDTAVAASRCVNQPTPEKLFCRYVATRHIAT